MTEEKIGEIFGGKIRLRVCGILIREDSVLLARHSKINKGKDLWIPPGGGLEFGETIAKGITREFREETGLKIEVGDFHSVYEFVNPPLHAVELFYHVSAPVETSPELGYDPEISDPIIEELRFVTFNELALIPPDHKHQVLWDIEKLHRH